MKPLLRMQTLMGSSYCTAVASSVIVMLKLWSPSMSMTVASGRATCAPTAAGRPKPIVPRPPELMSCRGRVNL